MVAKVRQFRGGGMGYCWLRLDIVKLWNLDRGKCGAALSGALRTVDLKHTAKIGKM